ncbi:MAG: GDP-mannose 4,6 dehydratase, partial [Candidatus Electrothrix sp. AR4]|nr:GDP-mannose 4,6 dehydratase [Candidatus Electrothrix sp. AR4]
VEAMWLMLQHERPDDYVIATSESNSLQDFVAAVFAALDLDWRKHVTTDSSLRRPVDIERSCGNAEKARRALGWVAQYKMRDVAAAMVRHELKTLKQVVL